MPADSADHPTRHQEFLEQCTSLGLRAAFSKTADMVQRNGRDAHPWPLVNLTISDPESAASAQARVRVSADRPTQVPALSLGMAHGLVPSLLTLLGPFVMQGQHLHKFCNMLTTYWQVALDT